MLVIHELAHSAPRARGAVTAHGITEREVARRADHALRRRLSAAKHGLITISGNLRSNIRRANTRFVGAQTTGVEVCAVSLHFNSTPLEDCPGCGGKRHKGGVCQCGAPSQVRWEFGHRAVVRYGSRHSSRLAREILRSIKTIIPWSEQRSMIIAGDPDIPDDCWPNTLLWPRTMFRPSALIEIGFGPDPRFAEWIGNVANQRAYGLAVAEGILAWRERMTLDKVPLADWKK